MVRTGHDSVSGGRGGAGGDWGCGEEDRGIVGGGEGVTGDRRSAEGNSKYGGSEPEWECGGRIAE